MTQPATLIFNPRVPRKLGSLELDIVIEETERYSALVTDHPVEVSDGIRPGLGSVSDHVVIEPTRHVMRGVVSDFPIGIGAAPPGAGLATQRSSNARALLLQIYRSRTPFDLRGPWGSLTNLVIESITIPHVSKTANALLFTAELREVQVARSRRVLRRRSADQLGDQQAKTQAVEPTKRGPVAGQDAEASLGAQALDWIKESIGGYR